MHRHLSHILAGRALCVILGLALTACSPSHEPADDTPSGPGTEPANAPASVVATPEQKAAWLKELPAPYNAADLTNGQKQFNKCRSCHTLYEGEMALIGPNLYTVFGRKAGTYQGYHFSDAMKAHTVVWDYDTLNTYLESPLTVVKGTKMGFMGVKAEADRRDLIAYIRIETKKP
jgi:cytochrome c